MKNSGLQGRISRPCFNLGAKHHLYATYPDREWLA